MRARYDEQVPLQRTLGFFLDGLPVIWVDSGILHRADPLHERYLQFLRSYKYTGPAGPGLTPELCKGYEQFVTIIHEIRHFHDALLCRPTFEIFILKNSISWSVLQIAARLPLGIEHSPVNWDDPRLAEVGDIQVLHKKVLDDDEAYFNAFSPLSDSAALAGIQINFDYLVETNAIVSELLHLYVLHGIRSVHDYYNCIIKKLDDNKYTALIGYFTRLHGNLIEALQALYASLGYCLLTSMTPTQTFCNLVELTREKPRDIYKHCNVDTIQQAFSNEHHIESHINSLTLVSEDGPVDTRVMERDPFTSEMLHFHRLMYMCRKQLIDRYVFEFGYNAAQYFERMNELPTPPIVFYPGSQKPDDPTYIGVLKREFARRQTPLFVIAAQPLTDGEELVIAGMTAVPGTTPAISFAVADQQLANGYFYRRMCQGVKRVYSPFVDHMYERILASRLRDHPA